MDVRYIVMEEKIVIAIDSFKGCLGSAQAGEAARLGVLDVMPDASVEVVRIADGGEGMAEAIGHTIGLQPVRITTYDPLMRMTDAEYYIDDKSRTAYIDMAAASGLTHVEPEYRNPVCTTTYGTGVMVADAISKGATRIVLGLGGSATNDAGLGALQALGLDIYSMNGALLEQPLSGGMMTEISRLDFTALNEKLLGVSIILACDVDSPFTGERGAVETFSPQKGASPDDMETLEAGMENVAALIEESVGLDVRELPGAGAAGGMGGGFAAAGAEIRSGVEEVMHSIGLRDKLQGASVCVTGEGSADRQTLMGKAPYGVMRRALEAGARVILIAGRVADRDSLLKAGFTAAECINPPGDPDMRPEVAAKRIRSTVAAVLTRIMRP